MDDGIYDIPRSNGEYPQEIPNPEFMTEEELADIMRDPDEGGFVDHVHYSDPDEIMDPGDQEAVEGESPEDVFPI